MQSVAKDQDNGFPSYWNWDSDGLEVAGTYLRTDEGPTAFGSRAIVVLDVVGTERSVWVTTTSLRTKLAEELNRRKARDFTVGERIAISRAAEKKTSAADRLYWPFRVSFPDAPKSDAADLLGLESDDDADGSGDEPLPPAAKQDANIPF